MIPLVEAIEQGKAQDVKPYLNKIGYCIVIYSYCTSENHLDNSSGVKNHRG